MTRFRSPSGSKVALANADDFEPFGQALPSADFEPLGADDTLVALAKPAALATDPLSEKVDQEPEAVADAVRESAQGGGDLADLPTLPGDTAIEDPFGETVHAGLSELPTLADDGGDDPFGSGGLPDLEGLPSLGDELQSLDPVDGGEGETRADPFGEEPGAELPDLPSLDDSATDADPFASVGDTAFSDPFGETATSTELPSLDDPLAVASPDDPFAPSQTDEDVTAFETALQEEQPPAHPIAGDSLGDAAQALSDLSSDPLGGEAASLGAPGDLDNLRHAAESAAEAIGDELTAETQMGAVDVAPLAETASTGLAVDEAGQTAAIAQSLVDEMKQSLDALGERLMADIGDSVAAILEPLVSRMAIDRAIEAFGQDIAESLSGESTDTVFHAEVPQNLLEPVRNMIEEQGLPVEVKAGRHAALLLHLENTSRAIDLPRLKDHCEAL
ncbi:hypothetical protein B7H23_06050 [Notoacmeibacter marinus]|uniref:Uncharacterized protein n=1 Tax=Notoacmeibacter marinus TaxID=1876515 RepID=A0A231V2U3_9HYPH|nr:hypothetical protein [Notoacmeibacter marinus]OXT02457.1 hypothetical protein B7H23_06050 [Notoacmeibacter marinus]